MPVGTPVIERVVDPDTLELLVCRIERVILKEFVNDPERLVDPDILTEAFGVSVPFGDMLSDL